MDAVVKEEIFDTIPPPRALISLADAPVIDLSSGSDSSSESESEDDAGSKRAHGASDGELPSSKKRKSKDGGAIALPLGFLDPLPPEEEVLPVAIVASSSVVPALPRQSRQFWKAGDFEIGSGAAEPSSISAGMDHVRVHPKFLHSNATSHKWALGAFAELMDNALDEICNGATYVNVDKLENKKDGTDMLLIEDNGGGMDPDKMRQCMSLGYSVKSKLANTIGQYGNGFKTSTMRLGADVIVFSRCHGKHPTQSIGMLSYTFLRKTGKEDIVVPILDYEKGESTWSKKIRSSLADWDRNLETILQWSPYSSEGDLLQQFSSLADQGTRIVIYNLWEDDEGTLELDFNADKNDIQLGGVNRDEKKIQMATQFPNSRHFLTYQHSLRSYASILYLRLPPNFKMILRGKEIEHHNIVDDMMLKQEITYRPQPGADGVPKDQNLVAVVTIGFVKDAKDHIDVQGFNVYHKNRLIKPFWRVWNAAGSDGRGVIGVLEANFVEPAHDKQGFERTLVLSRLEARLVQMQKQYWSSNCHRIGYAPRRNKKLLNGPQDRDSSPEDLRSPASNLKKNIRSNNMNFVGKSQDPSRLQSGSHLKEKSIREIGFNTAEINGRTTNSLSRVVEQSASTSSSDYEAECVPSGTLGSESDVLRALHSRNSSKADHCSALPSPYAFRNRAGENVQNGGIDSITGKSGSKGADVVGTDIKNPDILSIGRLKEENCYLKDRLKKMEESLQHEKDLNISLSEKLAAAERKLEEVNKEQEALIDIFSEERCRRDKEEETLRKKLKDASTTIQELLQKIAKRSNA